jgi:hypothetical protein
VTSKSSCFEIGAHVLTCRIPGGLQARDQGDEGPRALGLLQREALGGGGESSRAGGASRMLVGSEHIHGVCELAACHRGGNDI